MTILCFQGQIALRFSYSNTCCRPFHSQYLISNSPYYLPYNSYDVSSENLVLDQLIIP